MPSSRTKRPISFLRLWAFMFVILFILTIPLPRFLLPDPAHLSEPVFAKINHWIGIHLLGITRPFDPGLSSDSTGMYIQLLWLSLVSLLVGMLMFRFAQKNEPFIKTWFFIICRYFLALELICYGLAKLFMLQFRMPEPNILFSPLGQLHHDILYWSVMGSSTLYNQFMGGVEILAALLLLIRRFRFAGSLLALGIMVNVVFVNFSFDISVKLFSMFLLFLGICCLLQDKERLYVFLFAADRYNAPKKHP